MDLKKMLQKEHSKAQTNAIVKYIGVNPIRLKALIEVYLNGPNRITQRAAWALSICAEHKPTLVVPHLKRLLDFVQQPGAHDAVKRNTMRLLQFIDIPKRFHGQVANISFEFIQNRKEAVAIRVFSMTVLSTIVGDVPDLKNELRIILEDELPYASAAFKSRAKKVLKKL